MQLVTRPGILPGAPQAGHSSGGSPRQWGREEEPGDFPAPPPTSAPTQHPPQQPGCESKTNRAQGLRRGAEVPKKEIKEAASGTRERVESRTEAERPPRGEGSEVRGAET